MTSVAVTRDTVVVQDGEPIPATVEEETVLLSLRAGAYFGFNKVGTEIWGMLGKPRRVGEIFDTLSRTHDVDADTMARDVTAFLDSLIERRLLRVVEPGKGR